MKKRLTEAQFQEAVKKLEVGQQTIQIAYGVLVEGKAQVEYVQNLNLTRGAVSQAVKRVWIAHQEKNLPTGYTKVEAILPEHQAYIVSKWSREAKQSGKE